MFFNVRGYVGILIEQAKVSGGDRAELKLQINDHFCDAIPVPSVVVVVVLDLGKKNCCILLSLIFEKFRQLNVVYS